MKTKKKSYQDEIFLFVGDEGCEFEDLRIKHCTCGAVTGDISDKGKQIGFYMKVVGFYDKKAPMRNWGITIKSFLRRLYERREI
jgi:hypothetical protein